MPGHMRRLLTKGNANGYCLAPSEVPVGGDVSNGEAVPWRSIFGPNDTDHAIGTILHGARVKEDLTQAQLSELTGIPQGHISEMENGKRNIGVTIAKKLGEALNIGYKVFL